MKYYIYILYSEKFDKFYTGYTSDYNKRIEDHNTSTNNTFTSKYRPWLLKAVFLVRENKTRVIQIERFIKNQKSRTLLIKLIEPNFLPVGELAQLVRVPYIRD